MELEAELGAPARLQSPHLGQQADHLAHKKRLHFGPPVIHLRWSEVVCRLVR